ncbi:MAG: anthranilate phosphoribosyltransferase [Acidobacteria bacterium]|nr:anthranilate phosphoribosyltransferase [Acidobacteriota bacterium]
MLKPFIRRAVEGRNLSRREAGAAMEIIMEGAADDAQIAAFAVALRMKGESADEIAGFARAMRERAVPFPASGADLVDTCGTGGDGLSTPNVSTLAALVAAGAGVKIAKHGNRSATSRCGSADLLERLGVAIDRPPEAAARTLERAGIVFLFAPAYHPALKRAAAARSAIGVRSFFNLLGPLCNPARAEAAVIGVADGARVVMMAQAARRLGMKRALVVHGSDGMDELTLAGASRCARLAGGKIRYMTIRPSRAGLRERAGRVGRGGDPDRNAREAIEILDGRRGGARDLVVLNAAAVLEIGGAARDLREGAALAAESLDRGAAASKLEALR